MVATFALGGKWKEDEMTPQIRHLEKTQTELVTSRSKLYKELEEERRRVKASEGSSDEDAKKKLDSLQKRLQTMEVQINKERENTLGAKHETELAESKVKAVEEKSIRDKKYLQRSLQDMARKAGIET